MGIEIDVFKAIDVVADKMQNNSPLEKGAEDRIVVDYDIVYDETDAKTCVLDAYRIPKDEGRYPVLMYIHGGGFVAGDKRFRRGIAKWYAQSGIYVFNVNYGLCPDCTYPKPLYQLVEAMNWIYDHAGELNLDMDKFFVSGDSAGGYYASMLIAACNYKRVQNKLGIVPKTTFKAAVFNCGVYDIRSILEAKMLFRINTKIFKSFTGMPEADFENYLFKDLCSPTSYVNAKYPPVFVAYSKKDVLCRGQAERLIEMLEKKGVYYECYCSNLFIANHCFPLMWNGRDAATANKMTSDFVSRFIEGKLPKRSRKNAEALKVEGVSQTQVVKGRYLKRYHEKRKSGDK